jgi:hypothetical protein
MTEDKDWRWVLERQCPECGFNSSFRQPVSIAELDGLGFALVDLARGFVLNTRGQPASY